MPKHQRPSRKATEDILLCHISPTDTMPLMARAYEGPFMALNHLCVEGSSYVKYLRELKEHVYIYLDNSAFELGESCDIKALISTGKRIKADCLIAPDGDFSDVNKIRSAGFDCMVIPAGETMLDQTLRALEDEEVTFVGISYRHAVTYMRMVQHEEHAAALTLKDTGMIHVFDRVYTDDDPRARTDFMDMLNWLTVLPLKKIHMLGGTTPNEMASLKKYTHAIYSWDTSMAIWCSYNGVALSDLKEKFTKPVDFGSKQTLNPLSTYNIGYLEGLLHTNQEG